MGSHSPTQAALDLFRQHGGTLHTQEALRQGIHPRTLYALRDSGALLRLSRGLYRLADLPPLSNPDLVIVAHKLPQAVVCLVSALAFHELTTQIPHAVDIALQANDIVDVPVSGGKRLLGSLVGSVVPAVTQMPVRVIP